MAKYWLNWLKKQVFCGFADFADSAKYWLNWLKIAVLCMVAGESLNLTKKTHGGRGNLDGGQALSSQAGARFASHWRAIFAGVRGVGGL